MADLIIKPSDGNSLVLQDEGGDAALTVNASGNVQAATTLGVTGNATLSGTANALGTVTSGNLSSEDIVMPRFKQLDRFYYGTSTSDGSAQVADLNISGTNKCGPFTPEHNDDIFIIQWTMNIWANQGYMGWGVQMSVNSDMSSPTNIYRKGRHTHGSLSTTALGSASDHMHYANADGNVSKTASEISATVGTAYYFRMIGMIHTSSTDCVFGENASDAVGSQGVHMLVQRWSIV